MVAVVGRCLVGCEHYEGFCSTLQTDIAVNIPVILVTY